ncbi:MAG: NACHT domain-containing protein [Candidatus Protochlamydia sp.]|nr:NACHT domain-containing protein [Candidatus Protochlamydia sp.]
MFFSNVYSYVPSIPAFFSPPVSPFDQIRELDELQNLTSDWSTDKWLSHTNEVKVFIQSSERGAETLDRFVSHLMQKMIAEDGKDVIKFFSEVLSLEALNALAQFKVQQRNLPVPFDDVFEWAADRAAYCPYKAEPTLGQRVSQEGKRCKQLVFDFIPNLLNTFLSAFKVLVAQRTPASLWEYYLKFDIISKLLLITAYALIQMLQPFFQTTAKTCLAATSIILGAGIILGCYQKWLKPLPSEILHCTNVDKQMEWENIQTKVGQASELNQVISVLLTGFEESEAAKQNNVLLVGKSGSGKTSLLQQFVQLKKEGQLPDKLQELRIFEIDCGMLISSVNFDHGDLINQIKEQISGHENNVLFFLDGIDHLVKNPAAWRTFRKRFFEDQPSPRFIATTTFKEMEKIQELDEDGSFLSRVEKVLIEDNDMQCRLVVEEYLKYNGTRLTVTKEAVDAVLELSRTENYLPQIGRPRKAIRIMEGSIGRCEWTHNWASHGKLDSQSLKQARQELLQLERPISRHLSENPDELVALRALRERVRHIQENDNEQKQRIQKLKKIEEEQLNFRKNYFKLTHQLANGRQLRERGQRDNVSDIQKKEYILSYFYGIEGFKTRLENQLNQIDPVHPVQVNEGLVRSLFAESIAADERILRQVNGPINVAVA